MCPDSWLFSCVSTASKLLNIKTFLSEDFVEIIHRTRMHMQCIYILHRFSRFSLMLFVSWSVSWSCWKAYRMDPGSVNWHSNVGIVPYLARDPSQTIRCKIQMEWSLRLRYFFWFLSGRKSGLLMSGIHLKFLLCLSANYLLHFAIS